MEKLDQTPVGMASSQWNHGDDVPVALCLRDHSPV